MERLRGTLSLSLTVIVFFGLFAPLHSQVDYFSADNIISFAEYLYEEGDYIRAAGEYERYIFTRDAEFSDQLIYRIGLCYQLGVETDNARKYYLMLASEKATGSYRERAMFQIADTHFDDGAYDDCIRYILDNRPLLSQESIQLRMEQLSVLCYLHLHRWEDANRELDSIKQASPESPPNEVTTILQDYAAAGSALPYKIPKVAGTLSALLPGSGKVYAGRTKDGIYSLFTIALLSVMAYSGFSEDGNDSIKGWVFGSLAVVFYAANIYGSVNAARIHNVNMENQFTGSFDVDLTWR
jgi:tetratricopeptide (TPR) repeat protein